MIIVDDVRHKRGCGSDDDVMTLAAVIVDDGGNVAGDVSVDVARGGDGDDDNGEMVLVVMAFGWLYVLPSHWVFCMVFYVLFQGTYKGNENDLKYEHILAVCAYI